MAFVLKTLSEWPTDPHLVEASTAVLQAHGQLSHEMRAKLKGKPPAEEAIASCSTIFDNLRQLKSQIEGTYFKFEPIQLDSDKLVHLKHLTVAYTPSTLQEQTKAKVAEKLAELFQGQVKKLLFACILTCPWFAQAQSEVSAQAKNNLLYVVFVASDEQFFSLATPHERELCETMDEARSLSSMHENSLQGFLFAAEVRHFCAQLRRGNVHSVEVLCAPPESLILCSPEWFGLVGLIDPVSLLQRSFVDRCLGQTMGALVKKKKFKGQLVMRDDATLTKFCDSFRLLSYAECAVKREPICPWGDLHGNSGEVEEALALLKQGFEGVLHQERLLELVLAWKERVKERDGTLPQGGPSWSGEMGRWLAGVRMNGVTLTQPPEPSLSNQDRLRELLSSLDLPLDPRNVLAVSEGGSHLYGLSTHTSDTDYLVIFREPTEDMISTCTAPKETMNTQGQQRDREAAAYEARMFCEMLLKGAVNIFEIVFADEIVYASEAWKALVSHRQLFMSEKVILQYIGYVQTHLGLVKSGKHAGKPREAKIFYNIFHKLLTLERFVEGQAPVIRPTGEEREFIMTIRRGPLEGELSRDKLLALAQRRYSSVQEHLRSRRTRLQEYGDYRLLQTWLLAVRGVQLKEPLRLAVPPLVGDRTDS